MANTRLVPLHIGPEEEINIFFHGYCAVPNSKELEKLKNCIMSAKPRGRVYLFFWPSGDLKKSLPPWVTLAEKAARTIYKSSKMNPEVFIVTMGAEILLKQMWNFHKYQKRAEEVGIKLKRHISKIPFSQKYKINLIGHSLGARIIHYALASNYWDDYYINDVVLLAGATNAYDDDWNECLKEIHGKIYNVWSSADSVLKFKPSNFLGGEPPIGRCPIAHQSFRIYNKALPSFGHTDYWPDLEYVLSKGWKGYKPSTFIEIYEDFLCPHCSEIFEAASGNEYDCPHCRNPVSA